MKRIFLFLTLIVALVFVQSCGDDSDTPNNPIEKDISINPPKWIQGAWGVNGTEVFKFTNDDFIITTASVKQSHKKLIEMGQKGMQKVEVEEAITNSSYKLIITINGSSLVHKFEKVTASKIKWINTTTVTLVRL